MSTIAETLAEARTHALAGRTSEAEQLYRQALALDPASAEAQHGLGLALARLELWDEAVERLRAAAELRPDTPEIGEHLRAAIIERTAREGIALATARRFEEAAERFRQVVRDVPDGPVAHGMLGAVLRELGRLDEAAAALTRLVELDPGHVQAHVDLGAIARQQGRWADAAGHFRLAAELAPERADMHRQLGSALARQGQFALAAGAFGRAVELAPRDAEAHHGLAGALAEQDRHEAAAASYRRVLEIEPGNAGTHHNLAVVLARMGQLDAALAELERTIALQPDHARAHLARAGALLTQARFAEGWPLYEWRLRVTPLPPAPAPWPVWRGEPLSGRTLVLRCEQGLGDTFQFVRYAPLLERQRARVAVSCPTWLHALLERTPGITQLSAPDAAMEADYCLPLMSLPLVYRTTLDTIPRDVPYLFADPGLIQLWKERLSAYPGLKVGIVWQGNLQGDRGRSAPLASFAPLAELPGVRLVSLQKGPGSEQLAAVAEAWQIIDFGEQLDAASGPFMDTAAIMMNLDLVVTVDTASAHLAGALGVPVWVLLQRVPEWRWMLEREDSPWYPAMRLFRQSRAGDWSVPVQNVAAALREKTS